MHKFQEIEIKVKDGKTEKIHVIEVPFSVLHICCIGGLDDIALTEAAIRLQANAGQFERRVAPGWLDTLDDDSSAAVIEAALKLNINADRAKKAAGLISVRRQLLYGDLPSETSIKSGEPSNSSSPAAT